MSDVTAAGPAPAAAAPAGGFQMPSLGAIGTMLKRGDIALATGVMTILVGVAKLGFVADLLAKPTQIGYLTGLALTISQEWMRGAGYSFLAILHAVTVIAALLFLPFGKFFHIFQRPKPQRSGLPASAISFWSRSTPTRSATS